MTILDVRSVSKTYPNGHIAVKDVSLSIQEQECLGLVGESGSGKSTLARCVLQLASIDTGEIRLCEESLHTKNEKQLRPYRKKMQAVLQQPASSLNPKLKIKHSLLDPYLEFKEEVDLKHFQLSNEQAFLSQLLEAVELPKRVADCYPHELSGGQQQRVTIARAISIEPSLVVLDEPTSNLDVLAQASILRLLDVLRGQFGLSYLFISHDLAAVQSLSQHIAVMKEGAIVDCFAKEDLFAQERHPYTKELLTLFS